MDPPKPEGLKWPGSGYTSCAESAAFTYVAHVYDLIFSLTAKFHPKKCLSLNGTVIFMRTLVEYVQTRLL